MKLFEKEEDYAAFERVLEEAQAREPLRMFAYCVIPKRRPNWMRCAGPFGGGNRMAQKPGANEPSSDWASSGRFAHADDPVKQRPPRKKDSRPLFFPFSFPGATCTDRRFTQNGATRCIQPSCK